MTNLKETIAEQIKNTLPGNPTVELYPGGLVISDQTSESHMRQAQAAIEATGHTLTHAAYYPADDVDPEFWSIRLNLSASPK